MQDPFFFLEYFQNIIETFTEMDWHLLMYSTYYFSIIALYNGNNFLIRLNVKSTEQERDFTIISIYPTSAHE